MAINELLVRPTEQENYFRRARPINEQVILINGATNGLGRELARDLGGQGAMLILDGYPRKGWLQT